MKTHTHPTRDNDQIWGHFDDAARRGFARAAVPQEFFPRRRLLARRRQGGLASLEVIVVPMQSLQGKAAGGPAIPHAPCCQTPVSSL